MENWGTNEDHQFTVKHKMRWFQTTTEAIARNPIARAVAKQKLAASMRDAMIKFYLTPKGEQMAQDVQDASEVIITAIQILDQRGQDDPVMRAAISTLAQCSQDAFRWRPEYVTTVDVALQRALDVYRQANATETQRAYKVVQERTKAAIEDLACLT